MSSCLDSILLTLPTVYVFLLLFSTPYPSRFCLVLGSVLITELEFKLYSIFSPCSWHIITLGPNIFILQLYFQYINPCFTMLCYQMFSFAMGFSFYTVHPYKLQERLFCVLLTSQSTLCHCDQLCDKIQYSSLACSKYSLKNTQQFP